MNPASMPDSRRLRATLPAGHYRAVTPGYTRGCSCKEASGCALGEQSRERLRDLAHAIRLAQDAVHARGERPGLEARAAIAARDHHGNRRIELAQLDRELRADELRHDLVAHHRVEAARIRA